LHEIFREGVVTMGRPDSILGQFGETARCRDANFFVSICQHCQQSALLAVLRCHLATENVMNFAASQPGAGFVVLSHHSLFSFLKPAAQLLQLCGRFNSTSFVGNAFSVAAIVQLLVMVECKGGTTTTIKLAIKLTVKLKIIAATTSILF